MIDFANLEQYRENNRIEAKKALGGLPHRIRKTYCAFANTLGGVILLGVEEYPDRSLHAVDLPAPEEMIQQFWERISDPRKVSVNILTDQQVEIQRVGGKRIIVITVPRAQRLDRPVYMDGDPMTGSYRRNGEGDYRCTREEVEGMLRDAAARTWDMTALEELEMAALNEGTIRRYRAQMQALRPGYVWEESTDWEFLRRCGATERGKDGVDHPTAAGLLMFGGERSIRGLFPDFHLRYWDETGRSKELDSRSGGWSGNLCDFYGQVCDCLHGGERDVPARQLLPGGDEVERAVREALVNCLVNADYRGCGGVEVRIGQDGVTFSNPGGFRIEVETARNGGVSDPRNEGLGRLFNLIGGGEGMGGGLPRIYLTWRKQGGAAPVIRETFSPDRTVLELPFRTREEKEYGTASQMGSEHPVQRAAIIEYLTDHVAAGRAELTALLEAEPAQVRVLLEELTAKGILTVDGEEQDPVYRLKR